MGVSSSNLKETIYNIMKQMSKSNKFIHKQDLWTYLQKNTDYSTFDKVLTRLVDDGSICPTYDNDIFSIAPEY